MQGCGGELNEWIDGFTGMLKDEGIVSDSFSFNEVYSFSNNNLTNMAFALNDKDLDIGKLSIFRIKIKNEFGAMWLSDYIDNNLKDIDEGFKKVKAKIIGADGNVFNLIGICSRALKDNGYKEQAKELQERVTSAKSYDEALQIMMEYVEPIDQYGYDFEESTDFDYNDINM